MAITKSPPQAYTKELLTKAYNWLLSQPESIRYQARDADTLIQLYQLSLRRSSSEETIRFHEVKRTRSDNFHGELKNLLGLMDELESDQDVRPQPVFSPEHHGHGTSHGNSQGVNQGTSDFLSPEFIGSRTQTHPFQSGQQSGQTSADFSNWVQQLSPQGQNPFKALAQTLDEKTLNSLQRAQILLNLSSDAEALRALVQLGLNSLERNLARKD